MGDKNNIIIVLLVVLIGIVSGLGLIIGINNAITSALSPLTVKIAEMDRTEKSIEAKLNIQQGGGALRLVLNDIQTQLARINGNAGNEGNPGNAGNFGNTQQPTPPQEDMNRVYVIDPSDSPIIGRTNAPVTIVEFSDFQCPFCARFYPVVKAVLAAYPHQVRLVVKNFPLPFHPNARPAAKLAMAAGEQGKFQGMMESLLANGGDVTEPKIREYAQSLGLDYNKLMADYKNNDALWEKRIQADMQLGASVDVRGTPTFYLNGRKTDARDIDSFKAQINAILSGKK